MSKRRLTEDELITELNKSLREDGGYKQGMAFVPYPDGATGSDMSGYATTGSFHLTGIYARVAYKIVDECELK
jgi:hypothetical protein